jgi:L-rhamnose mutarotase
MTRVAFLLYIKPGCEEEYKRRHDHLWPEVSEEMKTAGIHSMSIFLLGSRAVVFLDAADYDAASLFLATAPASLRWEEHMADILETETGAPYDPKNAWPHPLSLVFDWRAEI